MLASAKTSELSDYLTTSELPGELAFKVQNTVEQARAKAAGLARVLYTSVLQWLQRRINEALSPATAGGAPTAGTGARGDRYAAERDRMRKRGSVISSMFNIESVVDSIYKDDHQPTPNAKSDNYPAAAADGLTGSGGAAVSVLEVGGAVDSSESADIVMA